MISPSSRAAAVCNLFIMSELFGMRPINWGSLRNVRNATDCVNWSLMSVRVSVSLEWLQQNQFRNLKWRFEKWAAKRWNRVKSSERWEFFPSSTMLVAICTNFVSISVQWGISHSLNLKAIYLIDSTKLSYVRASGCTSSGCIRRNATSIWMEFGIHSNAIGKVLANWRWCVFFSVHNDHEFIHRKHCVKTHTYDYVRS